MEFKIAPDAYQKLSLLDDSMRFEPAGAQPQTEKETPSQRAPKPLPCISDVTTPTGKKPILKAMMTTACERNCFYCPFRAGRNQTKRVTFTPDEMAATHIKLARANVVDGLFLSSGIIKGSVTTQDKIIDTAEILRRKYGYRGYLHLKVMPGAEYDQIRRIQWISQLRQQEHLRASVVTQFVVGAVGDTDLELLQVSDTLFHQMGLRRTYYSAFHPVSHTPFDSLVPTSAQREFRLYQASFLLRDYGWQVEDLPFQTDTNLPLDADPKRIWADHNLLNTPIELNTANRAQLLHVPGIGPVAADAIIQARHKGHLRELAHLHALGVRDVARTAPYILLNGQRPAQQLSLFES